MTTCSIPGCAKPTNCRGWCKGHYYRWSRYGDPLGSAPKQPPRPAKPREACSLEGCTRPQYAKGWCEAHYARVRRHGTLVDLRTARSELGARFFARVDEQGPIPVERPDLGPCHLWLGPPNGSGYGTVGGLDLPGFPRTVGAHVVAVLLAGDDVPEGMEVDHLCYSPLCVRRTHLEVVTPDENKRRQRNRLTA